MIVEELEKATKCVFMIFFFKCTQASGYLFKEVKSRVGGNENKKEKIEKKKIFATSSTTKFH